MRTSALKLLVTAAAFLLSIQSGVAQTENPKPSAATRPKSSATDTDKAPPRPMSDVAKTIKAAADALGLARWSGVGGGRLPEVDVVNRIEIWGTGTSSASKPGSAKTAFKTDYHAAISYNPPAMRVEMTRTNPEGGAPQHTIETVRETHAWNESELGAGLEPGRGVATPAMSEVDQRLLQLWILPWGVVKAAIAAGDKTTLATENGGRTLTFPLSGKLSGVTIKATLDAKSFITRVEAHSDNPALATITEADFSDYADHGEILTDLRSPGHIIEKQGANMVLDIEVKMADLNDPYLVFPVPDSVKKTSALVIQQPACRNCTVGRQ